MPEPQAVRQQPLVSRQQAVRQQPLVKRLLTAVSVSLLMLEPQAVLLRPVQVKPQAVLLRQVVYLSVVKHSVMFHGLMILQLGIRQQILLRLANTNWVKRLTGIVTN